ncbi:MAG: hypothetical protein WCB04_07675, partial [Mycobacteriales bacterium]
MRSGATMQRIVVVVIALSGLVAYSPAAMASPRNPSNAEIAASQAAVRGKAAEVGRITADLVKAEAGLQAAARKAEVAAELYNKARVDEQMAAKATTVAVAAVVKAQAEVARMRNLMDQFAVDNYRTGGTLGPLTALVTADNPADLIHDAGVLAVMSDRRTATLAQLDQATARQANARSRAQAALQRQVKARKSAAAAKAAAKAAEAANQATVRAFATTKAQLTAQLQAAQARAGLLVAARQAAIR